MTLIPCTALTTELRRLTIMSRNSLRFSGSTIYRKDFAFFNVRCCYYTFASAINHCRDINKRISTPVQTAFCDSREFMVLKIGSDFYPSPMYVDK